MDVAEVKQLGRARWVEAAARLGLVAKGVTYAIVGVLAIQVPLGAGETTDRQGALRTVAQQPLGEVLLLALAVGLAGYVVWRFAQAVLDRDREGSGPKGLGKRLGDAGKGLLYLALALIAFGLVAGFGSAHGDERKDAAFLLDLPLGRWLVGSIGAGFLVAGLYNGYRSLTQKFRQDLREHELAPNVRSWAIAVGVAGHAARAVVFGLIGVFLLKTALEYEAREAIGLDGALRKVAQQEYGELLLGVVAAGLIAYALFCFVQARYRAV